MLKKERAQAQINCVSCFKPRVVYAEKKVYKKEENLVADYMEVNGNIKFQFGGKIKNRIGIFSRRMYRYRHCY